MCCGRSGTTWLPSHHPGGCCTLVVDEEISPYCVKRFECLEKRYINVTNYYVLLHPSEEITNYLDQYSKVKITVTASNDLSVSKSS